MNSIIVATKGERIMKFKNSNPMIMNNDTFITNMTDMTDVSANLIFLDLSWSKLFPHDMLKIAMSLEKNAPISNIRNLNLSYNTLNFTKHNMNKINDEDVEYSLKFMETI